MQKKKENGLTSTDRLNAFKVKIQFWADSSTQCKNGNFSKSPDIPISDD